MTPDEFKAARNQLGLSLAQAADILGVNLSTLKKWEMPETASTRNKVNPTAAKAMRWMLAGFRPPEWPDRPAAGISGRRPKEGGD
ncbi:MAG TPA: helix-turn-helix domain-containing protein [Novosphingobium sp.]|jgi:transcriptional regulator with XRE-family HTH domain|nr:helix-turn-helix domain-containing protein [Novosphingobium sp.]